MVAIAALIITEQAASKGSTVLECNTKWPLSVIMHQW